MGPPLQGATRGYDCLADAAQWRPHIGTRLVSTYSGVECTRRLVEAAAPTLSLTGAEAQPMPIHRTRCGAQGQRVTISCGACAASSRLAIVTGPALPLVYMNVTGPLAVTSEVTL